MKLTLQLKPLVSGRPESSVTWDSDAGTVSGDAAVRILARLQLNDPTVGQGYSYGPTLPATDPLREPAEFACLISEEWVVPPELEPFLPLWEGGEQQYADILDDAGNVIGRQPLLH